MSYEPTLIKRPENWPIHLEDLMTNYSHEINNDVMSHLMNNDSCAGYPGWNFHALCWYDKTESLWFGQINQWHQHVDTISADTPEKLMKSICDKYGYE